MSKFFTPNISGRGRIFRAVCGVTMIAAGLFISRPGRWVCFVLVAAGGFVLFEAVRGWCVMRACGIKTKL